MSSIIEGYKYDIFISYRQKDNKGDRWVSKFVEALKTELESTFKEEISVYFDINPHDGLLETHDVDDSLKDKLKCQVFIPIISRTYCDPKSFAWEHEFKAFVKQASQDSYGLKIKLPNGNVASRVLPIRIHDLDSEDSKFCESILGGVIRGVEFIYKEPGINKPLTADDDERINLNKTKYRNQINKVANAVKDIISAIKKNPQPYGSYPDKVLKDKSERGKGVKTKYLLLSFVGFVCILVLIFSNNLANFLNHKKKLVRNELVINVITVNKTNDSARILIPAVVKYLLNFNISNKCNLTLLDINQFTKIYPSNDKEINLPRKSLDFRIINGEFLYQDEIECKITDNQNHSVSEDKVTFRNRSDLLNLDGNLGRIISSLGTTNSKKDFLTNDWEAFIDFYNGERAWNALNNIEAKRLFTNSVKNDTTFILPYLRLAEIYNFESNNKSAKELINIVKKSIGKLTIPDSLRAEGLWHTIKFEPKEAIKDYKALIDYLPAQKESYYDLAEAYFKICDIKNASSNYFKALTIDPDFTLAHNHYAYCFSASGQHDSALVHARKYLNLEPSANSYDSYGDILFSKGDLDSATWAKDMGLRLDPKRDYIYESLAYINVEQGKFKEAEKNINTYLNLQKDPLRISRGLTDKAFIYFVRNEYEKSLDTCLKAKLLFDSKDLLTRNHVLHWILSRIYLETCDVAALNSEMKEMDEIIRKNNIHENNYNMIYKFYQDIRIHQFFKQMKIDDAKEQIEIFDNAIYDKVKDWNYPFDISFFNTEFGKLYLGIDSLALSKERFDKALEYNDKYPLAHLGLAGYYKKMNQDTDFRKHFQEFNNTAVNADPELFSLVMEEFPKLIMK